MTSLMTHSHEVGTTGFRAHKFKELVSELLETAQEANDPDWLLLWTRKHGTEALKEAIACMIMQGHERFVIVRAFTGK